ncbi:MAG: ATP-dependent metallopeptidase FtsH/Yme1/Tma family protein, partial [Anaerolineae bacterium]
MRSGFVKNSLIYLLIVAAVSILVLSLLNNNSQPPELDISTLATQINRGEVKRITIKEEGNILVQYKNRSTVEQTRKEPGVSLFDTMVGLGVSEEKLAAVDILVEPRNPWSDWLTLSITVLPLIIIGGLLFFMLRQAQGAGNQAMSFGKSRAK